VRETEAQRAVAAAKVVAAACGLAGDEAAVLQDSNRLTVRLLPCDVLARVAPASAQAAQLEIDVAQGLVNGPLAALDPRVEPRVHERDGFVVTLWTYYDPLPTAITPQDYAKALQNLHTGMRELTISTPHVTDRVAEAQQMVASRDRTPELGDEDRDLLANTLRDLRKAVSGQPEQLLHGEPHPGNVLNTKHGPLFIDLETCCRGPVEFDLAHAPDEVADHYPGIDQELLRACRILVLAMITTWRWDRNDQLPDGRQLAAEWLGQIRATL
jgi:aminoglycoside phosphotransferase (APT) family kinase protein